MGHRGGGTARADTGICGQFPSCPQIADEPPIWGLTRVDLEMGRPPGSGGGCLRVGESAEAAERRSLAAFVDPAAVRAPLCLVADQL